MKAPLRESWQQLSRRDRQLCGALAAFLLVVFCGYGLWLPAQQRLETAHALFLKNVALADEAQRARSASAAQDPDQPFASRLSESAADSGLSVEQFELEAGVVRITLSGDAVAVLGWLDRIERQGARFESLSLEKRDTSLQARLQINHPT